MPDSKIDAPRIEIQPATAVDDDVLRKVLERASSILESSGALLFIPPKIAEAKLHSSFDLGALGTVENPKSSAILELANQLAASIMLRISQTTTTDADQVLERFREADIDHKNVDQVLDYVRKWDANWALDQDKSYRVRQWCLWKDKRHPSQIVQSWHAYTNETRAPSADAANLESVDWTSWHPKRRPVIQSADQFCYDNTLKLSKRMNDKPIALIMRGNTASGKTTALKSVPKLVSQLPALSHLQGVLDAQGKGADDAFNPDTVKGVLRKNAEGGRATHGQMHEEGSTIVNAMVKRFLQFGGAHVMDKRYGKAKQIGKVTQAIRGSSAGGNKDGYMIFMIDVDADLGVSCRRVLNRTAGGDDPLVPFHAVEEGYQEVRSNRDDVAKKADVDAYFLFRSTADQGDPEAGLVASRIGSRLGGDNVLHVEGGRDKIYEKLTHIDHDDEALAKKIYSELMDNYASDPTKIAPTHDDRVMRFNEAEKQYRTARAGTA